MSRRIAKSALYACLIIHLLSAPARPQEPSAKAEEPAARARRTTRIGLQRELDEIDESRRKLEAEKAPLDATVVVFNRYVEEIKKLSYPADLRADVSRLEQLWAQIGSAPAPQKQEAADLILAIDTKFMVPFRSVLQLVRTDPAASPGERNAAAAIRSEANQLLTSIPSDKLAEEDFMAGKNKLISTDAEVFGQFIEAVKEPAFERFKQQLIQLVEGKRTRMETEAGTLNEQIKALKLKAAELETEIAAKEEGQVKVDQSLISVAIPVFAVVMIMLMIAPLIYKRNDELQRTIFSSGLLLELTTVFLLTATVLILGLGEKIRGEVIGTLLGGISGYVLGRATFRKEGDKPQGGDAQVQAAAPRDADDRPPPPPSAPKAPAGERPAPVESDPATGAVSLPSPS